MRCADVLDYPEHQWPERAISHIASLIQVALELIQFGAKLDN